MEKAISDKASKKVALFYHPLFQNTIKAWSSSFIYSEANINMLIFIELNVRIQKVMISPFDFKSSLNSALTDWYRELDEIQLKQNEASNKPAMQKIHKPINYQHLIKTFDTLPFDLSLPKEKYTLCLKGSKNHLGFTYSQAIVSIVGFAKFLFDLCTSWCDELDIELFIYFINGIFLQMTQGESISKSTIKKLESIENWPEAFLKFFKKEKSQYQRYIKKDLQALQPWCEWNYFRIEQIQVKFSEQFSAIFPSSKGRIDNLVQLFAETREGIPRDIQNFDLQALGSFIPEIESYNRNFYKDKEGKEGGKEDQGLILFKVEDKSSMGKSTHTRVVKKFAFPILGKSYPKSNPSESGEKVKTIDVSSFFVDQPVDDAEHEQPDEDLAANQSLYPIWENVLSESISNSTLNSRTALNLQNKLHSRDASPKKEMKLPDVSNDSSKFQYTFGERENNRFELERNQIGNLPNGVYKDDASAFDNYKYSNIDLSRDYLAGQNEDLDFFIPPETAAQQLRQPNNPIQAGLDLLNASLNAGIQPKIKNTASGPKKLIESKDKKPANSRVLGLGISSKEHIMQVNNYNKLGQILPILRAKENYLDSSIFMHKFGLNKTQVPQAGNLETPEASSHFKLHSGNIHQSNLEDHDFSTSEMLPTFSGEKSQHMYSRLEQVNYTDKNLMSAYEDKKRKTILPGLNSKRNSASENERKDFFDKIGSIMIEHRKYVDLRKEHARFTRPRDKRARSLDRSKVTK